MERITNNQLRCWLRLLNRKNPKTDPFVAELQSALLELYCFRIMLAEKELIPVILCGECRCHGKYVSEGEYAEEKERNNGNK